jgi:hypothetical protein
MIRQDSATEPAFAARINAALTRRHRDADAALKANNARQDQARARINPETDQALETTR